MQGRSKSGDSRKGGRNRKDNRRRANTEMTTGRKRSRYLEGVEDVDARDYELLRRFMTEHGKIVPSRYTGATALQQRQIKRAIRRARNMGLLA